MVPAILLVTAIVWQLVVAGQTAWLTSNAARVAARAQAVGLDPVEAARSALPKRLEHDLDVETAEGGEPDGRVTVSVKIPTLLGGWISPVSVKAAAQMERQGP